MGSPLTGCAVGGPPNTTYGENIGVMAITEHTASAAVALP